MQTDILIQSFLDGVYDERLLDVYADDTKIYYQRERYINAIKKFEQHYKPGYVSISCDDHLSSPAVASRLKRPT